MNRLSGERGAALVIALLVLLVLSFLEIALIVTTTTESKISSLHLRDRQALEVAEAGIEEVISRMRLKPGDEAYVGDAGFPLNPDWVTVIHLSNTPNDTSGDTVYTKSTQLNNPGEGLLFYSTGELSNHDDLLIVRHKTGGSDGDSIYFCDISDRSQYLEAPDHGGFPVEVIEVKGRRVDAERKIAAEVARILLPVSIPTDAALYLGYLLDYKDMPFDVTTLKVCGHDHRRSLPISSGDYDPPYCDSTGHKYHADPCLFPWEGQGQDMETYGYRDADSCDPAGCVVGVKFPWDCAEPTLGSVERELYGNPAWQRVVGLDSISFPPLWEVLGFSTEEDMNERIEWTDINSAGDARGVCRVTIPGNFTINSSDSAGWGILWVRGNDSGNPADLHLAGGANYTFKGLLYVEGDLRFPSFDSELRVLGSAMLRRGGKHPPKTNRGKLVFIYSSEAIAWYLMEHVGLYEILSWREK